MPSLPQFLDRTGLVRGIEVHRQLDIEQKTKAHGHITIAAEIKINFEGICQDHKECRGRIQKSSVGKTVIYRESENICQQYLFGKSKSKEGNAFCEIFPIEAPKMFIGKLRHHFFVKNNRTGNKLWKKGNKGDVINERIMFSLMLASVYDEGNLLEGKKADTKRQQDIMHGHICMENGIDIFKEEIIILEIK